MNPGTRNRNNRKNVLPSGLLRKIFLFLFAIITLLNASPIRAVSACNPISAELCAAVDDYALIYLNGAFIDTFTYCDVSWACAPKCINLSGAQLALLADSGNVISVFTQNTSCCELWASWSLDIVCTGGAHAIVSSDNHPVKMIYDTTCYTPPAENPSPTPQAGPRNWYDNIGYNDSGWGTTTDMTGQKYGQRRYDPSTGTLLHALSYAPSMSTACGALWFREGFDLTPVPTPLPPAFTLSKTANPSTNIGQSTPYEVTFTLHICNTGGGTFGNPVTILDSWNDTVDDWQYFGPYSPTDIDVGYIETSNSGHTATFIFKNGFPNNFCYDFKFWVKMYSGMPTYCVNWHNIADLTYMAQPTKHATVTLQDYCPPPPVFTMVKSANPTSGIVNGTSVSYNMHLCNTGGAAWDTTGNMTIVDDWTNNTDNWQYDGPYYTGNPATGITSYSASNSGHVTTYTFVLAPPGFTGCIDIPMNMHMTTQNPGNCTWYNKASFSYFTSPTIVSTVNMSDYCSPTFSITPTFTRTPTVSNPSPTFTRTMTATFTRTATFTVTVTNTPQPPVMDITKTANVSTATFGDTITYTLTYHNTGTAAANPVCIYDTVPAQITYINSSLAPTTGAPLLSWCIGSVAAGGSGTITWWGRITSYPFNPYFDIRIYLADTNDKSTVIVTRYVDYWKNKCMAEASHMRTLSRE